MSIGESPNEENATLEIYRDMKYDLFIIIIINLLGI